MKEVFIPCTREDVLRRRVCSKPYMTAIVLSLIGCLFSFSIDAEVYTAFCSSVFKNPQALVVIKHILVCIARIARDVFTCIALYKLYSVRAFYKNGKGDENGLKKAVDLLGISFIASTTYLTAAFIDIPSGILQYMLYSLAVAEVAVFFAAIWLNARKTVRYIENGDSKGSDIFLTVIAFARVALGFLYLAVSVCLILLFLLEGFFILLFYLLTGPKTPDSLGLVYYASHAIATLPSAVGAVFWAVTLLCFRHDKKKLREENNEERQGQVL